MLLRFRSLMILLSNQRAKKSLQNKKLKRKKKLDLQQNKIPR